MSFYYYALTGKQHFDVHEFENNISLKHKNVQRILLAIQSPICLNIVPFEREIAKKKTMWKWTNFFEFQITIIRMMDEEHGVVHRRPKTKLAKKKSELRILLQGDQSIDEIEWETKTIYLRKKNCEYE